MNKDEREAFEEWQIRTGRTGTLKDGSISFMETEWAAWQAARSTIDAELVRVLNDCIHSLEYAAYNIDGSKLQDLDPRVVESTGVSESCLISARNAKAALAKHKGKD